jgi:hypothetical protein
MSALSDYTTTLLGGQRQFVFNGATKADVVFHYDYPVSDRYKAEFYAKVENMFNQRAYEDASLDPRRGQSLVSNSDTSWRRCSQAAQLWSHLSNIAVIEQLRAVAESHPGFFPSGHIRRAD